MKPLTTLQRQLLIRRIERDFCWHNVPPAYRSQAHDAAVHLLDGLEWTGVHGASEKRAVERVLDILAKDEVA